MAHKITMTTYSCPHCKRVIKTDGLSIILGIILFPIHLLITLPIIMAREIMVKLTGIEIVKMGSPYTPCKYCKLPIRNIEKTEWSLLKAKYKKMWSFRWLFRTAYILSGLAISMTVLLLLGGGWWSKNPVDLKINNILFSISVVFIIMSAIITYLWKRYERFKHITVTQRDYKLIKESDMRCKKNGLNAESMNMDLRVL